MLLKLAGDSKPLHSTAACALLERNYGHVSYTVRKRKRQLWSRLVGDDALS